MILRVYVIVMAVIFAIGIIGAWRGRYTQTDWLVLRSLRRTGSVCGVLFIWSVWTLYQLEWPA